jgi:(2Fe-2S) ferredoxin
MKISLFIFTNEVYEDGIVIKAPSKKKARNILREHLLDDSPLSEDNVDSFIDEGKLEEPSEILG